MALLPSMGCREHLPIGKPAEQNARIDASVLPRNVLENSYSIAFQDATAAAGIDFQNFDPATPNHLIQETMGCGVAWLDYDADGWSDLFCVQSAPASRDGNSPLPTHRLYRNTRNGRFDDVSSRVGLGHCGFATGVAVGDFDNDGYDDLAIASLEGLCLLRNVADTVGERRLEDVSVSSGVAGTNPHWATSCAWGDLDGDGWLDLYVCNYVETNPDKPLVCRDPATGVTHACPPTAYPVTSHRLYRNRGDLTFEDVTDEAGVGLVAPAAGLAVSMVDFDGDGRVDIYVANDMYPAYLFHNRTELGGPIKLDERAGLAGCGLGPNGASMSGMCVEVGDVDHSGRPSVFVTNFQAQPNILFLNQGNLLFRESSAVSGLGSPSRSKLGFGAAFLDADLDGHLDVAVANGHVYRSAPELLDIPYAQPTQIFRGRGNGTFRDVSARAGDAVTQPRVGRGVARADYDRDGKPDLAMSTVGGPVVLFRNVSSASSNWFGCELHARGTRSNRSAIGALAKVEVQGRTTTHFVSGGGSYLSSHERAFSVGMGDAAQVDRVLVTWPDGATQEFSSLAANTYWRLRQGEASAERFGAE